MIEFSFIYFGFMILHSCLLEDNLDSGPRADKSASSLIKTSTDGPTDAKPSSLKFLKFLEFLEFLELICWLVAGWLVSCWLVGWWVGTNL